MGHQAYSDARELIEYLCKRVENGSFKSVTAYNKFKDYLSIERSNQKYSEARKLLEYFCKRVEIGEIRSITTYHKFKDHLNRF